MSSTNVTGTPNLHLFAVRLLHNIGAPVTKANLRFIYAWAHREGTAATNNPLATTQRESGSVSLPGNSAGVQEYATLSSGAQATAATLENGNYSDVLAALRGGHPSTTQSFSGLKTWSGGGYSSLAGDSTSASGAGTFGSILPTSFGDVPSFIQQHLLLIIALVVLVLVLRK